MKLNIYDLTKFLNNIFANFNKKDTRVLRCLRHRGHALGTPIGTLPIGAVGENFLIFWRFSIKIFLSLHSGKSTKVLNK